MRCSSLGIISSCLLSLVLSILTIIAGCRQGVLDSVAIASYEYESRGTGIISPHEGVVSWFFSVHYLSLCGGYGYSTGETVEPRLLDCEPKEAGWIFKGNDPFIVNFQSVHSDGQDDLPVIIPTDLPPELHTRAPFAMLVSGIAISLFATLFAVHEGLGFKHHILVRGYHVGLCLIVVSAGFLLISSALITNTIYQSQQTNSNLASDFRSWVQGFLALTWASTGLMCFATLLKVSEALVWTDKGEKLA